MKGRLLLLLMLVMGISGAWADDINYKVNAVYGDTYIKTLASGTVASGSTVTVAYPEYIHKDGVLYFRTNNTGSANDYWRSTFTINSDVQTVEYTQAMAGFLGYFTEAESLSGVTTVDCTNRASDGKLAHTGSADIYVKVITLPAGRYIIQARGVNKDDATRTCNFKLGDEVVYSFSITAKDENVLGSSESFTVPSGGAELSFACEGSETSGCDWLEILCATTNTIVGAPDCTNSYLTAKSGYVSIEKGKTYHFSFVNHNTESVPYDDNWVLQICDGQGTEDANKVAILRTNCYDEVSHNTTGFTNDIIWDTNFNKEMNGATVDMDITYTNNGTINMTSTINTSTGKTWTYAYTKSGLSYDNITTSLSVSNSWLEILSRKTASITRTTATGKYGTICMPCRFIANGAKLYSVHEISGNNITLSPSSAGLAGYPYIYLAEDDAQTFTSEDDNDTKTLQSVYALTGCYTKTYVPGPTTITSDDVTTKTTCYILQTIDDVQGFYKVAADNTVYCGANKCYLKDITRSNAEEVRAFFFNGEGEETAISAVNTLLSGDAKIYDLNGRQLPRLQKGVNIVNGKKIFVK